MIRDPVSLLNAEMQQVFNKRIPAPHSNHRLLKWTLSTSIHFSWACFKLTCQLGRHWDVLPRFLSKEVLGAQLWGAVSRQVLCGLPALNWVWALSGVLLGEEGLYKSPTISAHQGSTLTYSRISPQASWGITVGLFSAHSSYILLSVKCFSVLIILYTDAHSQHWLLGDATWDNTQLKFTLPLQLDVDKWLSSCLWDVNWSDVQNFCPISWKLIACPPLFLPRWFNTDMMLQSKRWPCRLGWKDRVQGLGSSNSFRGQMPLPTLECQLISGHATTCWVNKLLFCLIRHAK